jgi:hypothetical protein
VTGHPYTEFESMTKRFKTLLSISTCAATSRVGTSSGDPVGTATKIRNAIRSQKLAVRPDRRCSPRHRIFF